MDLKEKRNLNTLNFITWLRVFAMICILLCHYVPKCGNPYIAMTSQFFNIGVQIFFIISGFCFGIQGEILDSKKWYKKRVKRIYIPYELFLLLLLIIYFILERTINVKNWIACVLGVQGAVVGVTGADHTWFITALLLCYIITPVLSKIGNYLNIQNKNKLLVIVGIGMLPLGLACFPVSAISTLGSPICFYIIAYILGRSFRNSQIRISIAGGAFGVICVAFGVRLLARFVCDGTILYDRIIVGYTQYIAAFAILVLFMFLFRDVKPKRAVEFVNKVSFEVYLCHYMFVVGPISLIHITNYFLVNVIIVTIIAFVMATVLNRTSSKILEKIG